MGHCRARARGAQKRRVTSGSHQVRGVHRRRALRDLCAACMLLSTTALELRAQTGVRTRSDSVRADDTEQPSTSRDAKNDVLLSIGGYLQVDGRLMSGTRAVPPDGLLLRRARLIIDARMSNGWHVRLQPDFGQSRVLVQDAFVGYEQGATNARIGRFRPAFGVERFQSSATLLHGERALTNSLMPSRSFGAQTTVRRGPWSIAIGGFRTPIGAGQAVDTDGDAEAIPGSGHDLLTRVAWGRQRRAHYVDLQAAALVGQERGDVDATGVSRLLTIGQQPLLAFRDDGTMAGTAVADGPRQRFSAGGVLGNARSMVALEGALFTQTARRGDARRSVTAGGISWRAAHAWGGTRRPTQELLPTGPRGAFDVGVRLSTLGAWGVGIVDVITPRSVTHTISSGVAFAWSPSSHTRVSLAYDQARVRKERGAREHLVLLRVQQGF